MLHGSMALFVLLLAAPAAAQTKPGDTITLVVVHRGGVTHTLTLTLQADPAVTVADLGTAMTPAQRTFRDAWLGSKVR